MIPDEEIDLLTETVDEAISMASEGRLSDGYTLLLDGFERAENLRAEEWDWVAELVLRWAHACANYAESYGVSMG
ncbi:MAG TPA: hypothetical protein VGP44_05235 [Gemmatimonadales bacterium]|nr:hypothetical protein [Gemmatimonadales bacterium]